MDELKITSSGKKTEGGKNAEQDAKLDALRQKADDDKARVTSARESAKAEKPQAAGGASNADTLKTVAAAAGAALLSGAGSGKKKKKKLLRTLILLAVIAVLAILFLPKLGSLLGVSTGSIIPGSLSEMQADEVMGFTAVDFQNAILGEATAKKDLIVLEQEVEVTTELSQALANIDIFRKTKFIHSYGTGVYTVDLSGLNADCIAVDDAAQTVTVTIPHTVLQYINKDLDRTEFEDTQNALLAFGEFKLTAEQQNLVDISIEEAMRKVLDTPEQFALADETALLQVREIFQPLVTAISDKYLVEVTMD